MTLEGRGELDQVLLSYDVAGSARSVAARACQIVFGRKRGFEDGRQREEPGFIHRRGVAWIGQSVLVLPRRHADELAEKLRRIGVRVALAPVSITRFGLQSFRRPG